MSIRCDYCRRPVGRSAQRYWQMRFCSSGCVEAYQQRLDEGTKVKIRELALANSPPARHLGCLHRLGGLVRHRAG